MIILKKIIRNEFVLTGMTFSCSQQFDDHSVARCQIQLCQVHFLVLHLVNHTARALNNHALRAVDRTAGVVVRGTLPSQVQNDEVSVGVTSGQLSDVGENVVIGDGEKEFSSLEDRTLSQSGQGRVQLKRRLLRTFPQNLLE